MKAKCILCVAIVCSAISMASGGDAPLRFRSAPPALRSTAPLTSALAVPAPPTSAPKNELRVIITPATTPAGAPLAPGVYKAEPYSLLVYVPEPIDEKMVLGQGTASRPEMPMIQPPLRLVPKDR